MKEKAFFGFFIFGVLTVLIAWGAGFTMLIRGGSGTGVFGSLLIFLGASLAGMLGSLLFIRAKEGRQ